jgi:hypothetical protein
LDDEQWSSGADTLTAADKNRSFGTAAGIVHHPNQS